ncbi:MAG: SDR family NAD(P)-dependent oxidoreductase [Gammaproteobacteria bacterium]|nr:SDR family NAD(P)-dependent oxidoreductase [Gammaproteobacteria bacterium]
MTEQDKQQSLMRRALQELRELRSQVAEYQNAQHEPIAVIGLGCRFPGGCDSPEELWQFLLNGDNARSKVPEQRWNVSDYYHHDPHNPGKINTQYGYFVNDIDTFDADFFAISTREAEQMDPQQRLLLEISWQTLERACIDPKKLRGSRTGVFIGCMTQEYSELINDEQAIDVHTGTGNAPSLLAGRLAYYYGLQGPTLVVDSACSSSLLSVHLAVQSLRNKESDLALAGGVNLQLSARAGVTESQAMMLAEDGLCKTFDESANGIGRGDGAGLIVLKRLADAIRDGDPICAVIKGSAVNHDGRSSGLTVPSEKAQHAVLQAALADASMDASQIGYIEAHGTGTALGDPIEIGALSTVMAHREADNPLYIGSLKTNFGHMEGAAGIGGLIKTILMLQHKQLPPHLNVKTPSTRIPWQSIPIKLIQHAMPWPEQGDRSPAAGVSAFGLSGTNVHMVLEQAPQITDVKTQTDEHSVIPLKVSAQSARSLNKLATAYQTRLKENSISLTDICYYTACARSDFKTRAVLIGSDQQQFKQGLLALSQNQASDGLYVGDAQQQPGLAIIFSGQGSQYPGMTADLYQRWPVYRHWINQCAEYLEDVLDIPFQTLLFKARHDDLQQTCYAQPAIFAVDYALYKLWQSWGIEPDAVMGHSLGEYVAACVAGVLSLKDALSLVTARARIMQQALQPGGMLAVSASPQQLSNALPDDLFSQLDIAAVNSPHHCVLSGLENLLEQARQELGQQQIHSSVLQVSHAFHSRLMEPAISGLQEVLNPLAFNKPSIPLVSNVTGQIISDEMSDPQYWLRHCRQTVRFADGIQTLKQLDCSAFLECGARPVLSPMLIANAIPPEQVFSSLRADQAGAELHCAARLYVSGFDLDWPRLFVKKPQGQRPVLPVYPFSGKRYWLPQQVLASSPEKTAQSRIHPLLHQRLALADASTVYFESWLSAQEPQYLAEHQVHGVYLAPLAVLLEILLSATQQLKQAPASRLQSIHIQKPLVLSPEDQTQIQIQAHQNRHQQYQMKLYSRNGVAPWECHLSAETADVQHSVPLHILSQSFADTPGESGQQIPVEHIYQQFQENGIVYGDQFKCLSQVQRIQQTALTQIRSEQLQTGYHLHPILWDACMQTAGVAVGDTSGPETWLPVSIDSIDIYQAGHNSLHCFAQLANNDDDQARVDLVLSSGNTTVLQMQGVSFKPVSLQAIQQPAHQQAKNWFYRHNWQLLSERDIPRQATLGEVVCFGTEFATRLQQRLQGKCQQFSLFDGHQLHNQEFWLNLKSTESNTDKPLLILFCAQDFRGRQPDSACLAFLALVQALEKQAISADVVVITCNAAAIDNQVVSPQQSAITALVKTASLECTHRLWRTLDVDDIDRIDSQLLATVLTELPSEQQLALHSGRCYAARLIADSQHAEHTGQALSMLKNRSYLVTGGSGALGYAVVEYLIDRGADHIVIVSRRGLSDKLLLKLQVLAQRGIRIIDVVADLALPSGIETLTQQLQDLPPLAGVVHAAGLLNDAALLTMSASGFSKTWAAKAVTLQYLSEKLPVKQLDFFVMFSSLTALTGSPGQGNYAAANAYADALMLNLSSQGCHASTINWSAWSGGGMVADHVTDITAKGFELIEPAQGVALFEQAINRDVPQVAVMSVDWSRFSQAYPNQVPNYYQHLIESHDAGYESVQGGQLRRLLEQTDLNRRRELLAQSLRQHISQVLHNPLSAHLADRQRLFDMGFDSVLAMEFTRQLGLDLNVELSSTLLFDYPTLEALLNYLSEHLPVDFDDKTTTEAENLQDFTELELSALLEQRLASLD